MEPNSNNNQNSVNFSKGKYNFKYLIYILIGLLMLGGIIGYYAHPNNRLLGTNPGNSSNTSTDSNQYGNSNNSTNSTADTKTIIIPDLKLSFEIPKDYEAFREDGYGGSHTVTIKIGKKTENNYYKDAAMKITISEFANNPNTGDMYNPKSPSDHITNIYNSEKKFQYSNVRYIDLLGQSAVRYTSDPTGDEIIVGLLNNPYGTNPDSTGYISISAITYHSGAVYDEVVFNKFVSSIKII